MVMAALTIAIVPVLAWVWPRIAMMIMTKSLMPVMRFHLMRVNQWTPTRMAQVTMPTAMMMVMVY